MNIISVFEQFKRVWFTPHGILIIGLIFLVLGITMAQGATLTSSAAYPHKIFKCQASTIYANYSNSADIVAVYTNLTPSNGFPMESFLMVNNGGGQWVRTYGNNNLTNWGNKSVSFYVDSSNPNYLNASSTYVFVYSDDCTGTNIGGYQNTTYRGGFGNRTARLFSGEQNVMEFAQQPYLDYFGLAIYLIMLFVFCGSLYVKNQHVMQPIMLAFIGGGLLVSSTLLPPQFKVYFLFLISAATAAIFWRLSKSA